ncbi:hypothetical protein CO660_12205 [Rhizobium sp. L9]|uniref:hypothetical protein n=1 Tax=Rhizobium sp. L9 TaxID=1340738 RepID=UPI000BE83344|nr:hypothetical protein [Rhizobium sp. L9]PDT29658.1 hypothetical protein CO660_12205 [Rhizobium sp. L9]
MGQLWEKVTYYRHRSELAALRLALRVPLLAMHLIGAVVFFWWGVAGLSVLIPTLLVSQILGTLGLLLGGISTIVLLLFVTPWFSGWYCIAAGVMFGRTAAARAKGEALARAIHAYREKAV